jgi:hypothetical protein
VAKKSDGSHRYLVNKQRELDHAARPALVASGADRTGAPPLEELARAERSALLSFLPRAKPWAELDKYDERLADLRGRHAEAAERARGLAEQAANEPRRHADEVASWTLNGEKGTRPESRAQELEHERVTAEAKRDGLQLAVDRVLEEHAHHVERHRARLVKHADQLVDDCHGRLAAAIEAVERERAALAGARESALWARLFPSEDTGRMPRFGTLAGARRRVLQPLGLTAEVDSDRVLTALRADAEWLRDAISPEQREALGEEQPFDHRREAGWDGDELRESEHRDRVGRLERLRAEWGHKLG